MGGVNLSDALVLASVFSSPAVPPPNEFGGIRGLEVERQYGRERRCGVGGCVYIGGGAEFGHRF